MAPDGKQEPEPETEAAGAWAAVFVSKLLHNNSIHMNTAISIYQSY